MAVWPSTPHSRHVMWSKRAVAGKRRAGINLKGDHAAVTEARTLFPNRIYDQQDRVLKDGYQSRKIGRRVTKGRWKGFTIWTLTLEERNTCPTSCAHWRDCYGNNMQWAHRQQAGDYLEQKLYSELRDLNEAFPTGFLVRLHVLGDFYSVQYIELWREFMDKFKALHVFGFTAHQPYSLMGDMLDGIRFDFPMRWWLRHSDADSEMWLSTGETGLTCPMQQKKTDCCATCGLCWTAQLPIKFLQH